MLTRSSARVLGIVTMACIACDGGGRASVPTEGRTTSAATASASTSADAAPTPATPTGTTISSAPVSASAPPELDLSKAPALFDDSGTLLAQTKDEPTVGSPAFQRRLSLLWRAIVDNDPTIAEPAFFPVEAYEKVKDIEKPKSDWKHRLMKNFHRDVRKYHAELGPEPKALTFVALDLDEKRVKWIEPGKEGNKIGYHRITRSKLRYKDPAGQEKTLELTSLISWRGEWFVVHLHGFK